MQANFDKARKLINELEAKLIDTSTHTAAARKALDAWIQSGEAGLGKKGSSALKQVRKRADSFTKSLTKLEHNLATSLDKLSDSQKKEDSKKASKKTAKKAASKKPGSPAKKETSKPASPAVKKSAVPGTASKKKAPAKKAKS
jgi:hypothetical protein